MHYIIKHPTVRNGTVMIQCPPKTELGRWKTVHVKVDGEGVARVSPAVWENEINQAQIQGLTHENFLIIGQSEEKGPMQSIPRTTNTPDALVGIMETPNGHRVINFQQFQTMMSEAKRENRLSGTKKMSPRPKEWSN